MHPFTELEICKINLPGLSFEIGCCRLDQPVKVAKCDYALIPTIDNLAPLWEWAKSQDIYLCHCSDWDEGNYHLARRVRIREALVRFHGYALDPIVERIGDKWVISFSPYAIEENDLGCVLTDMLLNPDEWLYIVSPGCFLGRIHHSSHDSLATSINA